MNPTLKPEDLDNMVMYERTADRRSGSERRNDGQMHNRDLRKAPEKRENPKPYSDTEFISDFG